MVGNVLFSLSLLAVLLPVPQKLGLQGHQTLWQTY